MADLSGSNIHPAQLEGALEGLIGFVNDQTLTIPVNKVILDGPQRLLDETKVIELMKSILSVGVLNPIIVAVPDPDDVENIEEVRLVTGRHRLEATKRLGIASIQCTVLACGTDALLAELAEIDENIIRRDPSAVEHALLTRRRSEIIRELGEEENTLSQIATMAKEAPRRPGGRRGRDFASIRYQAMQAGQSKDRIHRSIMRARNLGGTLDKLLGTSLDKGVELDELAKLPEAERKDLADRAASGEAVSARTANRRPKARPNRNAMPARRDKALAEFTAWKAKYSALEELAGLTQQISEIELALSNGHAGTEG